MIEWLIFIAAVWGALAAFVVLTIVLRAAWLHRRLPRDFPRAISRRKRKRGAAKRPVQSINDVD